jgi:hypothetical protein
MLVARMRTRYGLQSLLLASCVGPGVPYASLTKYLFRFACKESPTDPKGI